MFETKYGGIEQEFDIEGWKMSTSVQMSNSGNVWYGWVLYGHKVCGSGTRARRDENYRPYCPKCDIRMPMHVYTTLLKMGKAHRKGVQLP